MKAPCPRMCLTAVHQWLSFPGRDASPFLQLLLGALCFKLSCALFCGCLGDTTIRRRLTSLMSCLRYCFCGNGKPTTEKWCLRLRRTDVDVQWEPRAQWKTRDLQDQWDRHVSTPVAAQEPKAQSEGYGYGKGGSDIALAQRPAGGKAGGKGKGLSHFERIDVGIEEDESFRAVQRLIGPRGKNIQDITMQRHGSKVWIIGRGSRSWEDSVGSLMICVGATTRPVFDSAVNLIQELLGRVREDHKAFLIQ
jgi:hypothetical protein